MRSLGGDYRMIAEAAEEVGVSPNTLRRYIQDDREELLPSRVVQFGRLDIYLYTQADIDRIKEHVSRPPVEIRTYVGRGRKGIYTPQQRAQRSRLTSRRYYWRSEYERAAMNGDDDRLAEAEAEIKKINKELEEMPVELD